MKRIDDNMRDKVFTINDDGRICENGLVISNERIVLLLNEADFVREDLRIEKSRNDNMKSSLHHFRSRCLKFEVGLKDVVGGHEDLRKFAKRMGVI